MKLVYRASDVLEAHVVQGLLAQYRISAFIQGEFSVGGTGELAPQQGTDLLVNNDDYEKAREIVAEYEQSNSEQKAEEVSFSLSLPRNYKWLVIAGLIMAAIEASRYFLH